MVIKFISKTFVFLIPLILFFTPPFIILLISGENFTKIDELIKSDEKYLIGYVYNEENYKYLKYKEIEINERKKILALGSSRVLQFRDKMFSKSFYNAGYTVSKIDDFIKVIKTIEKDKLPEVLIIALDQWMFNKNWDNCDGSDQNSTLPINFISKASIETFFQIWKDIFNEKMSFKLLFMDSNIDGVQKVGLNAFVNNKGFRKDGSMFYGSQIDKLNKSDILANDYGFKDTFERIEKGERRFEYGNEVNNKAIIKLNEFLNYCKSNNVFVVAIIPPFANEINKKMINSKNYIYINEIYSKCKPNFDSYGFELWDLNDLDTYNANDLEMLDGFHGSEVVYLKMLIFMLNNNSKLNLYSNKEQLIIDLNSRMDNYTVYGY